MLKCLVDLVIYSTLIKKNEAEISCTCNSSLDLQKKLLEECENEKSLVSISANDFLEYLK